MPRAIGRFSASWRAPKEDKAGCSGFLAPLKGRGLAGVRLIVSDACMGLVESAAEFYPEARWQRCMVHFYRNVFSHVPATKVREVSHIRKFVGAPVSWARSPMASLAST